MSDRGPRSLQGAIAAMVTPLDDAGEALAADRVRELVNWLSAAGLQGLFVAGTTGEGPLLGLDERRRLAEVALEAAAGRLAVAIHVGAATTAEAVALARHAARKGADAVTCVTPWYFAHDEPSLADHFARVAEAANGTAMYLYTIPSRTGNEISPRLIERLIDILPNLRGIKDSTGSERRLHEYLSFGPRLAVLCGSDPLAASALRSGAAGFVSGPASCLPEAYVALHRAWAAGDEIEMTRWEHWIRQATKEFANGARLDYFKHLLARRGIAAGRTRRPLAWADKSVIDSLLSRMKPLLTEAGAEVAVQ
jgi:4-hydroxy-tetrahydrodipicolinate synthase